MNLVSPNSARTYFNKIKAGLSYARRDKVILVNPAESVGNIRGEEVERVYLTFDEIKRLSDTPSDRDEVKRGFLFSCFTGLRLSDIKRLTWSKVKGTELVLRIKKTGQPEYFPLSKAAIKILGKRGEDKELVFKMVPSEDAIWTAIQRWVKAQESRSMYHFMSLGIRLHRSL